MSVEVIADCDECGDKFDRDARDKTYCQTCYEDVKEELEVAKAMIANLEDKLESLEG